jgi:hypothetical protein
MVFRFASGAEEGLVRIFRFDEDYFADVTASR